MLLSMLAVFSLPVSADGLTLAELDAKYNVHYRYDPGNKCLFNGTAQGIIGNIRKMIADGKPLAEIQAADAAADESLKGTVVNRYDINIPSEFAKYPDYEEWKTYYKPLETSSNYIQHIRIISEDQWRMLIADTSGSNPLFTNQSQNITLHLDAPDGDFDMQNVPMNPVGYNATGLIAHINGHGQVFKNIKITFDVPTYSVGLISTISKHRVYQDFGVESGIIQVTGTMPSDTYIGGIAGNVNSSGGAATSGVLRKLFFKGKLLSYNSDVFGILGRANTFPVMDACFSQAWLEVTATTSEEYNSSVGGLAGYAGNVMRVYNSMAHCVSLVNTYSEYRAISYHGSVYNSTLKPITNCYGGSPFVSSTVSGYEAQVEADNVAAKSGSAAESAYKLNQTYVAPDYATINSTMGYNFNSTYLGYINTDRIYYTLASDGTVSFGNYDNQIRKVTIVDRNEKVVKVFYANSNSDVDMNYHLGVNYYALVSGSNATINHRKLHIGDSDVVVKIAANVNSGKAYGSDGINLMDAQMVLRAAVGLSAPGVDTLAGDVNFDNALGADDAVLLIRYWMGDTSGYNAADYPLEDDTGWMKVASYNVKSLSYCADPATAFAEYWCYGTASAPHVEYTSQYQADECAQILNAAGADLVGLQEIQRAKGITHSSCSSCFDNTTKLASLANYSYSHMAYNENSRTSGGVHYRDSGAGILSKFSVTAPSENVYYAAQLSAESEQRMYTRYTISGSQLTEYGFPAGSTLVWYNTHLGSVTRQQMAQLGAAMEADYAKGFYVIATADFNQAPKLFNNCVYGNYSFNIATSHFTMANGGKFGNITNGERQQIDNILISDNLEFYWDPATQNALYRIDADNMDNFVQDNTAAYTSAPKKSDASWDSSLKFASDHSLVYAYVRVKK